MSRSLEHLSRLFPPAGYRLAMNLRPLDAGEYFAPRRGGGILGLRQRLLRESPEHYLASLPEVEIGALQEFLRPWTGLERPSLLEMGGLMEPDLVLLRRNDQGGWKVAAGCVCFPTMWSLPEKLGLSLEETHAPVPGLNPQLGSRIDQFMNRITPDAPYGRENWGLTASEQLDQHPRHVLSAISAEPDLTGVWLRVEDQALVRLKEDLILFAIRIENYRLDEISSHPLAESLANALATMPPEILIYKRLNLCQEALIRALRANPPLG